MTELQQFVDDMASCFAEAKATDREKEVGKAWLRFAIAHAQRKASRRKAGLKVVRPEPVACLTGNA